MRTLFRERGWFSGPHASPRVWEARKHDHTLERCVAVRIHHTGPEHRRSVARRHKTPCASVRVCISGKLQPWVKYEAEKLQRTSELKSALRWGRFGYNLLSNNDRSTFFLWLLNTTARSWKPSATKKRSWRMFRPLSAISVFPSHRMHDSHAICQPGSRGEEQREGLMPSVSCLRGFEVVTSQWSGECGSVAVKSPKLLCSSKIKQDTCFVTFFLIGVF